MSEWLPISSHEDGPKTLFRGNEDGTFSLRTYQDCESILEANKRLQNDPVNRKSDFRRVASIPVNIFTMWSMEAGIDLMALKKDERVRFIERKLADPAWAHLRTA